MNKEKQVIEQKINNRDLEDLDIIIKEYEEKYPYDLDLFTIKMNHFLFNEDIDQAMEYAREGLRTNPCNAEMHYNFAVISEMVSDYQEAYEHYVKAYLLFDLSEQNPLQESLDDVLDRVLNKITDILGNCEDKKTLNKIKNICKYIDRYRDFGFEMFGNPFPFQSKNEYIDSIYSDGKEKKYYVKRYNHYFFASAEKELFNKNLLTQKGEFVELSTYAAGCELNEPCDILLPLANDHQQLQNIEYHFTTESGKYDVTKISPDHYNYYRLPGKVKFKSNHNTVIGKPVLLKQDPSKKKLILNIFVDGLAQTFINSPEFEQYMHFSSEFFSKGVLCKNVYSNSEWTYPSIATINSGLDAPRHMMISPQLNIPFPHDAKLLPEYFQEAGYYTAKIGGNWRITPNFGYLRGYDRLIYQHRMQGLNYDETVQDTLEHLEMAKETNQFVWIEIGDLHDIAEELDLPPSIQASVAIEDVSGMTGGVTSVKQTYNQHKINLYKIFARRVDLALSSLYRYIEDNYTDDEIIISLFSDHGQGYMIKEGVHFLAPERTNTALLIRSSFKQQTVCDEYIATADYIEIIGKLSGLSINSTVDSNLPEFFGGKKKRSFVISESLHAKDNFKAAIHGEDINCYITSEEKVRYDGRITFEDYEIKLTDKEMNEIKDSALESLYLQELRKHIAPLLLY